VDEVGGAPQTVHLHVGAMKTGTSYLQGNLDHSRDALARSGVLYPGRIGPAVHDVLEKRSTRHAGASRGAWDDLVAEIRAWPGPTVVASMEFLGLASPEQAGRMVESLRPARVQIVITARDLARTIPSAWQQTTKNRQTVSWPEFLAAVPADRDREDAVRDHFWRHHDITAIARTWSAIVGPEQVTVLTVPRPGTDPSVLWDRFCTALGLDHGCYPVAESHAWNFSLGFAEAEMMRRLNAELGRGIDQPSYRRLVTEFISGDVLRGESPRTSPPQLPAHVHDWAVGRSEQVVSELAGLGVRVVGDLAELVPSARELGAAGDGVQEPVASEVATVAIRAVAALVNRLAEGSEPLGAGSAAADRGDGTGDRRPSPATAQELRRLERRAARRAAARAAKT